MAISEQRECFTSMMSELTRYMQFQLGRFDVVNDQKTASKTLSDIRVPVDVDEFSKKWDVQSRSFYQAHKYPAAVLQNAMNALLRVVHTPALVHSPLMQLSMRLTDVQIHDPEFHRTTAMED